MKNGKRIIMTLVLIVLIVPLFCGFRYAEVTLPIDFALWQSWIDKYIMPIGLSLVACIGSLLTVWSKIKSFRNMYKTDKDAFFASAQTEIAGIRTATDLAITNIIDVKDKTVDAISKMPIATMQNDLEKNTSDIRLNAKTLVNFTGVLAIMITVLQKTTEAQIIGTTAKKEISPYFEKAQKLIAEITQTVEYKKLVEQIDEGVQNESENVVT